MGGSASSQPVSAGAPASCGRTPVRSRAARSAYTPSVRRPGTTVSFVLPPDALDEPRGRPDVVRGYAIVRLDERCSDPEGRFTILRVVFSRSRALAEVERLTALNESKGAVYFLRLARIEVPAPGE